MEHGRTLLVEVTVENFDRVAERVADDRPAVAGGIFLEIVAHPAEDVVEILIVAEIGLAPDAFEEGREALVEPRVRPIAAGDQIAEPLVREFVRDERIAREIEMGDGVVQRPVCLRGGRRILHAAEDEVGNGDL